MCVQAAKIYLLFPLLSVRFLYLVYLLTPSEAATFVFCNVDSPLLAPFRKRVLRYLHIECAAAEDSIPLYGLCSCGTTLEVEHPRTSIPSRLLCYCQFSVLKELFKKKDFFFLNRWLKFKVVMLLF